MFKYRQESVLDTKYLAWPWRTWRLGGEKFFVANAQTQSFPSTGTLRSTCEKSIAIPRFLSKEAPDGHVSVGRRIRGTLFPVFIR